MPAAELAALPAWAQVALYRLEQAERRIGRLEAFVLGVLATIALSFLGGLVTLLSWGGGS